MRIFLRVVAVIVGAIGLTSSNTLPTGDYGSLAIDARNGNAYGWAVNYNSWSESDARALEECRKYGGNCHVVLNFKGGCGAYVVEKGNPYLYGWGVGKSREQAEQIAMDEARAQGGKDLVVRVWGCNGESPLQDTVYHDPNYKGVFGFYFTKSDDDMKCFISPYYYIPAAAQKSGSSWVFSADAKERMTPQATKFLDAVEDNLYGYLGDLKDKVITRGELDWKGLNEVDYTNHTISYTSVAERKEIIENSIAKVTASMRDSGYEVIEVAL
ncbi:MAG: DUF4189 domain-containing protein [Bacteroidia bacterium]